MTRTILHVEDDYIKAANLRDCLADYECDVKIVHVTTVQDGLAKLADGTYACCVTDWNLGGGTGDTIVHECQRLSLPVCVMSGSFPLMRGVEWFTSDRLGEVVRFVRRWVVTPQAAGAESRARQAERERVAKMLGVISGPAPEKTAKRKAGET